MKKGVDYIGVGTGALIFNESGEIFISQRGPKAKNERGKWEFPGGGVEFGETCEKAIMREVKEEFDFEIKILELLEVVNHIIPDEGQHWVSPTYLAKYSSGNPKIMEIHKCLSFKWVKLEELQNYDLTIASEINYNTYTLKFGFKSPSS